MLSDEDVAAFLTLGHESRGVEFKGAGSAGDSAFRAVVIRAALGIANRRDGGYIIVGVDDNDPTSGQPGLSEAEIDSWMAFDDLATWFGEYVDPAMQFEVAVRSTHTGAPVIVIEVQEFEDVPVLCRRAYDPTLKRGALYTRSHARPETSDTHQHAELRELLDLAIEKGLRRFVERATRAGLAVGVAPDDHRTEDDARFTAQLEDWG